MPLRQSAPLRACPARRSLSPALLLVLSLALALQAAGEDSPHRGFRGLLALRGGEVLATENPGRLFTPGSVQKLVVSTAALHHLGPDYRVVTRLVTAGARRGPVVAGNLVVLAAGDPTWSARFFPDHPRLPLTDLARQLIASGVRQIDGDLVVETGRFPGRPFPPSRALSEFAYGWAAPTSALAVDDNQLRVEMGPGARVGEPGVLRLLSGNAEGQALVLENHLRTVGRERHGEGTVDFLPVWENGLLVARGEYPVSEPSYQMELVTPRPALAAGLALRAVLEDHGVKITGEVRVLLEGGTPAGRRELARFAGPPLAQWLPAILEDSSNWHAEMLLRVLAAEVQGEGRDTTGLEIESLFLRQVVGLPADSFELDDASGISPYNLLSPEAVVALLHWAWRQPWRSTFLDVLASPGEGTLRVWGKLPPLAAKSGTVRHSLALAGYLDPQATAEPVIFALFLNHRSDERTVLRAEIVRHLGRLRR